MAGARRSVAFASLGRYTSVVAGLVATVVVARLMRPGEFGVSVIGSAALGLAQAVRELGSVQYLVQERDLTIERIRTSVTISIIVTVVIAVALIAGAPLLAAAYGRPGLAPYVIVLTLGFVTGPFVQPIYGLLTREGRFGQIALIDTVSATVNAAVMIILVVAGFSFMGIAWAGFASAVLATVLFQLSYRDHRMLVPCLKEWRRIVSFGIYGTATSFIYRSAESVWFLVLGRLLDARAVGLLQRALLLATFPDRVILSGVGSVALRSLSSRAHRGDELSGAYLRWIAYASAIAWPALLMIALFASQIVAVLLGDNWHRTVPLVEIIACSTMLAFPVMLNSSATVAADGMRDLPKVAVAQALTSLPILAAAATVSMMAVAWSTFLTSSAATLMSTIVARRHVGFTWRAFAAAIAPSLVPTFTAGVGPAILLVSGVISSPFLTLVLGGAAGAVGWLVGIRIARHPLADDVNRALAKVLGRLRRHGPA